MNTCWLCGHPIEPPLEIIGNYRVGRARVAHRRCLRILGEHELELGPDHLGLDAS